MGAHSIAPEYGILQVYDDGSVQQQSVKRRVLLRNTGLQPRDLRRIDPSAASTNSAPFIVVRPLSLRTLHVEEHTRLADICGRLSGPAASVEADGCRCLAPDSDSRRISARPPYASEDTGGAAEAMCCQSGVFARLPPSVLAERPTGETGSGVRQTERWVCVFRCGTTCCSCTFTRCVLALSMTRQGYA
jgi:hypothetical protein